MSYELAITRMHQVDLFTEFQTFFNLDKWPELQTAITYISSVMRTAVIYWGPKFCPVVPLWKFVSVFIKCTWSIQPKSTRNYLSSWNFKISRCLNLPSSAPSSTPASSSIWWEDHRLLCLTDLNMNPASSCVSWVDEASDLASWISVLRH